MFHVYNIFGSHMVLQREREITISGTASPREKIKAAFAGCQAEAVTGENGEWQVSFPPQNASAEPRTLTVWGPAGEEVVFHDILIGEVWVASGQSNMELPVYILPESSAITADAINHPNLRIINLSRTAAAVLATSAFSPRNDIPEKIKWQTANAESVNTMSGIGWYFGCELENLLPGVPIGILHLSLGGSPVEAWTSLLGFERSDEPDFTRQLKEMLKATGENIPGGATERPQEFLDWLTRFRKQAKLQALKHANWNQLNFDDSGWTEKIRPIALKNVGTTLARGSIEIAPEWAGRDLTIALGFSNDCDETFFNGEPIGKTDVDIADYWLHQRGYRVPGRLVRKGKNVIAMRVENHCGEGVIVENCQLYDFGIFAADEPRLIMPLPAAWKIQEEYLADIGRLGARPAVCGVCQKGLATEPAHFPCALYNALIHPWIKYPVRGVIWYQGCANAGDSRYFKRMSNLITDWRIQWNNPQMPFLQIQLAGFENAQTDRAGDESYWRTAAPLELPEFALTREIQFEVAKSTRNGLAAAIDVGEQWNIHPSNKKVPACRLAQVAGHDVYGLNIACRGPEFEHFEVLDDGAVKVFFTHAENGLATSDGKAPGAFALRGEDGKLHWGEARIVENTVIVKADSVRHPSEVRYAFVSYRGDINLLNKEGFPALPFRSNKPEYPTSAANIAQRCNRNDPRGV